MVDVSLAHVIEIRISSHFDCSGNLDGILKVAVVICKGYLGSLRLVVVQA
jgi:hypothetical protein